MATGSGIYQIQSKINPERIYIGSAIDFRQRWANHISHLRHGKHHSPKLQCHYNKYGESDLVFSVLLECQRERLIPVNGIVYPEQLFLWACKPWFNVATIAGSQLGTKRSDETKRKIGEKSRNRSKESNERMAAKLRGRKIPRDIVERMASKQRGKKHTEETKRKMSEIAMGRFLSEEIRRKISETKKRKNLEKTNNLIHGNNGIS